MKTFQFHQKGCGRKWLLGCGICPVFTVCPEHSPSSTSAAAQLQKHSGKVHETPFQLIFYLKVSFLILKKQLLAEREMTFKRSLIFYTICLIFLTNYFQVVTYSKM